MGKVRATIGIPYKLLRTELLTGAIWRSRICGTGVLAGGIVAPMVIPFHVLGPRMLGLDAIPQL